MNKQSFHPSNLFPTKEYGFSHVVSAEGKKLIFCSGQTAFDKDGSIVGKNDLGKQVRKSLENIRIALAEAGSSMEDVCRLNIYIVNYTPDMLDTIHLEMGKPFNDKNLPASTLLGVQALASPEILVELEATAVVGS